MDLQELLESTLLPEGVEDCDKSSELDKILWKLYALANFDSE